MIKNLEAEDRLKTLIDMAFAEDLGTGDLATQVIFPESRKAEAYLIAKADGVISGLEIAKMILEHFGPLEDFTPHVKDGDRVTKGQKILDFRGDYAHLLSSERIMLNFLQRMSGIATATRHYVDLLSGTRTRILDTRKTLPGHRYTDKMAVLHGGGMNHRMGLYDMCLLKDNHITVSGGVRQAIEAARAGLPVSVKIEIETETLPQVKEALDAGADIIMLDNMDIPTMRRAVEMISGRAKTEASGNITSDNIAQIARETGVDFISSGALTHSVKALDISMKFTKTSDLQTK